MSEQPKQAKNELPIELAKIHRMLIGWELIGGIAGYCWFAACAATIYFFIRAIFYSGSWWYFGLSLSGAWLLYHISLSYHLEGQRVQREVVLHHAKSAKAEEEGATD
jgi:hypothetical protein